MPYTFEGLFTLEDVLKRVGTRTVAPTPPHGLTIPQELLSWFPDRPQTDIRPREELIKFTDGCWLLGYASISVYSEVTPDEFIRVRYAWATPVEGTACNGASATITTATGWAGNGLCNCCGCCSCCCQCCPCCGRRAAYPWPWYPPYPWYQSNTVWVYNGPPMQQTFGSGTHCF
jgi:hypothetical protein